MKRKDRSGPCGQLAAAAAIVLLSATSAAAQYGGLPEWITQSLSGERADGSSREPSLSYDGRFVAFESNASDLVPGDTNNNTDIFVYDAIAGQTNRVSLNWKGQEARGDSYCPAISGDGRYVTFLSRAWNMFAGGANLGGQPLRVFVHDRHAGTTEWISGPIEEQISRFRAFCPSISADGGRVVFPASFSIVETEYGTSFFLTIFLWDRSTGMVGSIDGLWLERRRWRDAVISGDGQVVVFSADDPWGLNAIDLDTGIIQTISSERPWGPFAVSHDGRFVTFLGGYGQAYYRGRHVYLHDRQTVSTLEITEGRAFEACGREGSPLPCQTVEAGKPSISADGRFVVYGSRSSNLVAESTHRGGQIYAFDRITERTRRISVSPEGLSGEACSYDPAISPDGKVVAYKSAAEQFSPGQRARWGHQMIRAVWQCDESGCREDSACPPMPTDCTTAERSSFEIRRRPPGGNYTDRLRWRWRGSNGDPAAFPNPAGDARYHLCVYTGDDQMVDVDIAAPTSGWQEREGGYRLRGEGPASLSMRLRPTDRGPIIFIRGTGPQLDLPYLPLLAPSGLTVQLHDSESGSCWGTHFPAETIERNHAGTLASTGPERRGRFIAKKTQAP